MTFASDVLSFLHENLTLLSALGTVLATLATGVFALKTYQRALAQKRVEWLNQLYDRFFFQQRFEEVRRIVDYALPADVSRLKGAIDRKRPMSAEDIELEERLVDFLNFFNLVAAVRHLGHIELEEIKSMFKYYLCRIGDHDFLMTYLRADGFDQLADLVDEVRADEIKPDYLFVYGTLKRGSTAAMAHFLTRYADFYCEGTTRGQLYNLGTYPGAVASDNPHDVIHGEVFKIRQPTRALDGLDEYEEVSRGLYRREVWPVLIEDERPMGETETSADGRISRTIEAWVYVYNQPLRDVPRIQSGRFGDPCGRP